MNPAKQKALAALSQYEAKIRHLMDNPPQCDSDLFLLQRCAAMVLGDIVLREWKEDGKDFSSN